MGAPMGAPWAPYGAELPPQGAKHGPLGPLWGGFASKPSRATAAFLAGAFFSCQKTTFLDFWSKNGQKKVEIEGVRPIWRDPQRNSVQNPASVVQNGRMATHFKPNWCHFGSLGVPAPASTPLPGLARWGTTFVSLGSVSYTHLKQPTNREV